MKLLGTLTLLVSGYALIACGCQKAVRGPKAVAVRKTAVPTMRVEISAGITINGKKAIGKEFREFDEAAAEFDRGGLPRKDCEVTIDAVGSAPSGDLNFVMSRLRGLGFERFNVRIGDKRFTFHLPRQTNSGDEAFKTPSIPAVHVSVLAKRDGEIAALRLDEKELKDMEDLRAALTALIGEMPADSQPPVDVFANRELKLSRYAEVLEAVSIRTNNASQSFPLALNIWPFQLREGPPSEDELSASGLPNADRQEQVGP